MLLGQDLVDVSTAMLSQLGSGPLDSRSVVLAIEPPLHVTNVRSLSTTFSVPHMGTSEHRLRVMVSMSTERMRQQ